ncbi:hypothetical protein METP2_03818 [Methanosarcinales archaeon]|nr:hypothetical protein [Candidatus Methanoperedens sp. BLZ2]MBZ0177320.1 hypothetical protein [Candidatus Methanoperedens nitroreducens]MCX9079918.1 hypothetical protein [Candidatus Methanoperedens sp.]MCX9087679.1 hypothetical protein [Candidatus Methanoperedens sp.]CAG1007002.1 hypothetical protein METP2_03818 [Methanosarcinales archaeon]
MSKKEQDIKAKINWDELYDFWSCQYEEDYGQYFNIQTHAHVSNRELSSELVIIDGEL